MDSTRKGEAMQVKTASGTWDIRTGTSNAGRREWVATTERCGCSGDEREFDACHGPISVSAPELEELYVEIADAEEFHFGVAS